MELIEENIVKSDEIYENIINSIGDQEHLNKEIFNNNLDRGSYTQLGQYGIVKTIFDKIGTTNRYYVEFGAMDGFKLSNTADLRESDGWSGLLLEGENHNNSDINLYGGVFVSKNNINDIFDQYKVPKKFDFLSLDIDGNDYWVWDALTYKSRVVLLETNPGVTNEIPLTIQEDGQNVGEGYFGANLHAFYDLAVRKGYRLVTTLRWDAFFMLEEEYDKIGIPVVSREECISKFFTPEIYWFNHISGKEWVNVTHK